MTEDRDTSENRGEVPARRSIDSAPWPGGYGLTRLTTEPDEGVNWSRYLATLVRYKWLVLAITLAGLALGLVLMRFVIKPEHVAQATVWVEASTRRDGVDRGPIRQGQLLETYGWVDLLKSYMVLDSAVRELRLFLQPTDAGDSTVFQDLSIAERFRPGAYRLSVAQDGRTYALATDAGTLVERGTVGDSIGRAVGLLWSPTTQLLAPGRQLAFTLTTPRDAARSLANRLNVRTDLEGNFLRVELRGTDPRQIAATVNAVVERYVDVAAQLKREKLTELARILDEQLRQAERNLRNAESALESYRVQTITLPSDRATPVAAGLQLTRDPVFQSFFEMRIELEQIRRDRDAIEQALTAGGDSALPVDGFEVIGSVQASSQMMAALRELTENRAELRALSYRYTSEHPPVQRLQGTIRALEQGTIPDLAAGLIAQLEARKAELDGRIASASRELRQIPPRVIQEARLEREVAIADNLFTMLQQRYAEARLAEVSSIPDVRILDAAVAPQQPVSNQAPKFLAMSLFGGLGLGIALSVLLDRFDRRVRYPDQVTVGMGLPILGAVPHFKGSGNGAETAPVVESLRGVRLSLVHAYGAAGPLVVTISSPGAGEGKSFIAANLAIAFTDAGHRTLLIDGDVRRGTLHRMVSASRQPGLTDILADKLPWERCVQQTGFDDLQFVGGGTRMPRGPQLLGLPAVTQLLTRLRASYSVIIVDSPPLGAGVDAYALSTATGNLLIVLRTGSSNRELAQAKLQVLDRLPVRIVGAVLNDVSEGGAYRYYSQHIAGYEYNVEAEEAGKGKQLRGNA